MSGLFAARKVEAANPPCQRLRLGQGNILLAGVLSILYE
jgi:hypothetical protein